MKSRPGHHRSAHLALLVILLVLPLILGMRAEGFRPFLKASSWRFLALGLAATLAVSATALVLSLLPALLLALARRSPRGWLRWPALLFVEGVRALPLVGLIFLAFLYLGRMSREAGISALGRPATAVILSLLVYTAAVNAESLRAAMAALPRGQWEASAALGLSPALTLRRVILPQALRLALPNLIAQFATLVKDSSLGSIIGFLELYRRGVILFQGNRNPLETLYVVSLIYLGVNMALGAAAGRVGGRLSGGPAA